MLESHCEEDCGEREREGGERERERERGREREKDRKKKKERVRRPLKLFSIVHTTPGTIILERQNQEESHSICHTHHRHILNRIHSSRNRPKQVQTANQNSLFRSRDHGYQPIRDQYFLIRSVPVTHRIEDYDNHGLAHSYSFYLLYVPLCFSLYLSLSLSLSISLFLSLSPSSLIPLPLSLCLFFYLSQFLIALRGREREIEREVEREREREREREPHPE
eukprot:sb/3469795/